MNYYPRYPGDYVAKTLDLTMIEDGAYTRLLDWYYSNEQPVPHARRYAIARATMPAEKAAVDAVLAKFFDPDDDGSVYRHERVDQEIGKASPRIKAAKSNGSKGGRRPKIGVHAAQQKNPVGNPVGSSNENPEKTQQVTQQVTQWASSPTPEPEPTPKPTSKPTPESQRSARELGLSGTEYGRISGALRRAGVPDAEPGGQRFRSLVDAGATLAEFMALVPKAMTSGDRPFAYLVGCVEGERKRAARTEPQLHHGAMQPQETPGGRAARLRVEAATPRLAARKTERAEPEEIFDVTVRHVG